uniref:Uncharacterized protein n=1 Tax=viral metagenome TaxID=1070528 RepID=A0A6C0DV50_9ZZZZ
MSAEHNYFLDDDNDDEEEELEETKEDDEELWGAEENNQNINANNAADAAETAETAETTETVETAETTNLEPIRVPPEPAPSIQNSGRIRRRGDTFHPPPQKIFRNNASKRIASEYIPTYKYIKLKSGEEFYFEEDDGKNIILNETIEPSRLIRNIISKIPVRLSDRIKYLGKFASDEDSDVDSDEEEKVQKRYLGNLKEAVYGGYIKEWRLRYLFKKVLIFWRTYRMNKMYEKEIDPITLSEPEKEVYIYDWTNKRKFVFDAKSLATLIESKLMYHEHGFPVPQYPKNPKNNVEFSYKQLVSLYNQLKVHGELRWGFTTLREYNFNKNRWHMYHKSALTMNSIRFSISLLDTYEARDLFADFIFAKMEELGLNHSVDTFTAYQIAMIQIPTHWYLEKLKSLAISYYEAEHLGHNRKRIINAACVRIFRKHNQFMEDLRTKNIIK